MFIRTKPLRGFAPTLAGIMASLTKPLAEAGVSVFAISTYDTDYLLIGEQKLPAAIASLRAAGFTISGKS